MPDLEASRTLVKSAPELWAECSDAAALARHLGAFGEIRITKLEPETSVAWEGDEVRGTVTLETSGWGTRVVLTATPETSADPGPGPGPEPVAQSVAAAEPMAADPVADQPEPVVLPELEPVVEPEVTVRPVADGPGPGWWARLLTRLRGVPPGPPAADVDPLAPESDVDTGPGEPAPGVPPASVAASAALSQPAPPPEPESAPELQVLVDALESLGAAHRRPFSRG